MLGNVTEKVTSKVAPLVIGNLGGFPKSVKRKETLTHKPANSRTAPEPVAPLRLASEPSPKNIVRQPELPASGEEDVNTSMVLAMSEQERQEALEEIRSLISPKHLAFLQSRPLTNIDAEMSDTAAQSRSNKVTDAVVEQKSSAVEQIVTAVGTTVAASGPEEAASQAHDIFAETALTSSASVTSTGRSSAELNRFDLNGRKIVSPTAAREALRALLEESTLLPAAALEEACSVVLEAVLEVSSPSRAGDRRNGAYFALDCDAALAAAQQPQDELRHHQYDQEKPGYNFTEIGEMFRSQFSSQRVVAMRMLAGVLLRRDCVVALEAYSQVFSARDGARSSSSAGGEGARFEVLLQDEVGRRSDLLVSLSTCFEETLPKLLALAGGAQTAEDAGKVRRVLVHCFLQLLCAPDLPVELPTLLLWALASSGGGQGRASGDGAEDDEDSALAPSFGSLALHNNPAVAKLALLRCVALYLRSPAEEAAADWLRRESLLWGISGFPRLATPHARRPGIGYEQYMRECADRAVRLLQEDDEEDDPDSARAQQKQSAPESVLEAFALQCRWSRIEALTSRGNLVAQLVRHACVAASEIANSSAESAQGKPDPRPLPASMSALLAMGAEALMLLKTIVRQGGAGSVAQVHRQLLGGAWREFRILADVPDGSLRAEMAGAALQLRSLWWQVLAELVTRDSRAAGFLWGPAQQEWLSSVLLRRILQGAAPAPACDDDQAAEGANEQTRLVGGVEESRLATGLLRSCLASGYGFSCVTELVLAQNIQHSRASSLLHAGDDVAADFLLLLEEAAVTAAAMLRDELLHVRRAPGTYMLSLAAQECLQVCSAVVSFVRQHAEALSALVAAEGRCTTRVGAAVLALLCAVLQGVPRERDGEASVSATAAEYCGSQLAAETAAAVQMRGPGLVAAVAAFSGELLQAAQRKKDDSLSAASVHVSGQCLELLECCRHLPLFTTCHICAGVMATVASMDRAGANTARSVVLAETLLLWQRFLGIVINIAPVASRDDSAALQLVNTCARSMRTPYLLHLPAESGTSVETAHALGTGAVADGLLGWHTQRLQHAAFFVQASIAASLADRSASLLPALLRDQLATQASPFFAVTTTALFRSYVQYLVCLNALCAHPAQDAPPPLVALSVEQRYHLAAHDHEQMIAAVCDSACPQPAQDQRGARPTGASDWLTAATAVTAESGRSLTRNWAYAVLGGTALSGAKLGAWLSVLAEQQQGATAGQLGTDGSGYDFAAAAERLYALLKLAAPDQAAKWQLPASPESDPDAEEQVVVCAEAVRAYRSLLFGLVREACAHGRDRFCEEFCGAVARDFAQGAGMLQALRRTSRRRAQGIAARPARPDLEGVFDLCEKALDAALNQLVDADLHAAALLVLGSPCMPWAVRQKIWAALGSTRLVHLLEDPAGLSALLPVLLPPAVAEEGKKAVSYSLLPADSAALYVEMVDALLALRGDSDRQFQVVAVCVEQLVRFVFSGVNAAIATPLVAGSAAHVLEHLQSSARAAPTQRQARWLLRAVLALASVRRATQQSGGDGVDREETSGLGALTACLAQVLQEEGDVQCPTNLQDLSVATASSGGMGSKVTVTLGDYCKV